MSDAEAVRENTLLTWATDIQAIAQIGLAYAKDKYDLERYHQLMDIAAKMMIKQSNATPTPIQTTFMSQKGYASPKVDVRAFIVENNKLLMVKESQDGKWSLPGGWADVNHTPSESIIKEIEEETGFKAQADHLLALWDTALHDHPPQWPYIYKCIFACSIIGGDWRENHEILDAQFFDFERLPELSSYRITATQIKRLKDLYDNNTMKTSFD